MNYTLHHGDVLSVLPSLEDNSVDSIVTDPPYEIGFMGKDWDNSGVAYSVEMWTECLRVLKPGGHLLAFGAPRSYHRMTVAIEDAGFEIRDSIHWTYGSGFPKNHNVHKATGDDAWEGWGTVLKPSHEPIVMARKSLSEKSVAANVLKWGTGAINIDGCRVGDEPVTINTFDNGAKPWGDAVGEPYTSRISYGRFPANSIFDEDAGAELGEYACFFYCPKPNKRERNAGAENTHPTVKPLALMRYLVRLVTPPEGVVLDTFAGSGTTMVAAIEEGFTAVGIELTDEYLPVIRGRCDNAQPDDAEEDS